MSAKYLSWLGNLLVLICLHNGRTQIATFDVQLENLLHMQQGIGWPLHLYVTEGHEALMKLSERLENQQTCEVTTPSGVTFNVHSPPGNRYEPWSDGCGVRVKNVVSLDVGRWRMTATRGNHSITGWSEVHVTEEVKSYTPDTISLIDGQKKTLVDLTSLNNSYCLVTQPFTESSLVAGHCQVTLDRTTRAVQGTWSVWLGIPGRVTELHVDTTVVVEAERLDVGYVREADTNKLHLYCNILHTTKNITFCRFQKSSEESGFNVMDGLSDGRYSYYGRGFSKRHCGLTIESVTDEDYGTWRCTLGVVERVGHTIHQLTPMQALVTVPVGGGKKIPREIQRSVEEHEIRRIFVEKDSNLTIMFRAEVSLLYCWFQHPNGTQFTPVPRQLDNGQPFWYTGESLQFGDCGITFANVSIEDAGIWTCHMGHKYKLGVEIMEQVDVRVSGPLAANKQEVGAEVGGTATLYCHSSNGARPLDYCRFLPPSKIGFSLDSSVNEQNVILDRFYFTPGRSINYGDCSLTISAVSSEDFGEWTCAALLHDHLFESSDTIRLYASVERVPHLQAGLVGAGLGIVFLALVLGVVIWYKKGRPVPTLPWTWSNPLQRFSHTRSDNDSLGMSVRVGEEERRSSDSTTSSNELEVRPRFVRFSHTRSDNDSLGMSVRIGEKERRSSDSTTSSNELEVRPRVVETEQDCNIGNRNLMGQV
ncbi:hypothetical protein PYW08_015461 [Mythimna loreyi]|uniref:Uncharacterized protein n=1 Tax=Mythimna loreyi TaxID=667449 RepID=A0ACC2R0V7_9NEOP|nr:hypothetical protein PYW08_015461 [Mythimna loreyi]